MLSIFSLLTVRAAAMFAQISGREETAGTYLQAFCTNLSTNDAAPKFSSKLALLDLAASRLGLDPALNRFHAPLVNHEDYSFPGWPENHTFPVRAKSSVWCLPQFTQVATLSHVHW